MVLIEPQLSPEGGRDECLPSAERNLSRTYMLQPEKTEQKHWSSYFVVPAGCPIRKEVGLRSILGIVGAAIFMMVMASTSTSDDAAKVHDVAKEFETLSQRIGFTFPTPVIIDLPLQIRET